MATSGSQAASKSPRRTSIRWQATEDDLKRFAHIKDKLRRTYCAMVYRLDKNVGKILNEVRRQDIERDTLIVFLSDNGGPSAPQITNGSVNVPFRGSKTTVLEGGIRVPMLLRWPAVLPAGKTVDDIVSSLDIVPTCMNAAGGVLERAARLDGSDLVPLLTGVAKQSPHESLMWNWETGKTFGRTPFSVSLQTGGADILAFMTVVTPCISQSKAQIVSAGRELSSEEDLGERHFLLGTAS